MLNKTEKQKETYKDIIKEVVKKEMQSQEFVKKLLDDDAYTELLVNLEEVSRGLDREFHETEVRLKELKESAEASKREIEEISTATNASLVASKQLLRRKEDEVKDIISNYDGELIKREELQKVLFSNSQQTLSTLNDRIGRLQRRVLEEIAVAEEIESSLNGLDHVNYNQIKTLVYNKTNVYIYGPSGAGKNYTVSKIAKELDLKFYFSNAVKEIYTLKGFVDANSNYNTTEFRKAFENGGLFFLDEFDASDEDVVSWLNSALANGYAEFPDVGRIEAHEDFRVIAAGNTDGNGATSRFNGRNKMEASTKDRFAFIEFDYNEKLEKEIFNQNEKTKDLYKTFKEIRESIKKNSAIDIIVSTRTAFSLVKYHNIYNKEELIKMFITKGSSYEQEIFSYLKSKGHLLNN